MRARIFSQFVMTILLVGAALSTVGVLGIGYRPVIGQMSTLQTISVSTQTTTENVTIVSTMNVNQTVSLNMTVVSTETTSMLSGSDLTTLTLATVAVAAFVIAVYALKRGRPSAPAMAASVSRVIMCPSCGASNKPGATYCRKCRTRLR